jgi:hypothetical protein
METSSQLWIWLFAIAVVVAAAVILWTIQSRRRSSRLRAEFGQEYDRTVQQIGHRAKAEQELELRRRRVQKLDIRRPTDVDCDRFSAEWRTVQARFVEDPQRAVGDADALVGELMTACGYPMGEFEQRAADISVDHPRVVEKYRAAHTIALRQRRGEASTEDLRTALVHYRALFEDLLGRHVTERKEVHR